MRGTGGKFAAIVGLLLWSLALSGQPLPVPQLSIRQFDAADLQQAFAEADQSRTATSWEEIMTATRYAYTSAWEMELDAQILGFTSAVSQTDHFHTEQEYRDYLTGELATQRQTLLAEWELEAEYAIQIRREPYLAWLATQKKEETVQESDKTISQTEADKQADTDKEHQLWQQQFKAGIADGLAQFATALGEVDKKYNEFLASLQTKAVEFEENRLQIEHYEQVVRDGIQQTVHSLESYLAGNGLFYLEQCQAYAVTGQATELCNPDMNVYNAAGLSLQNLIQNLQAGLDADAPLSQLAVQMNDYLENEKEQAETRTAYWLQQTAGNNLGYSHPAIANMGYMSMWSEPAVAAVLQHYGGNSTALMNFLGTAANDPRQITGIDAANVQGYSDPSYAFLTNGWWVYSTHFRNEYYSDAGESAFFMVIKYGDYNWDNPFTWGWLPNAVMSQPQCGGNPGYIPGSGNCRNFGDMMGQPGWTDRDYVRVPEQYLAVTAAYSWYDANADHNQQVWSGYVNDLNPVLAHWSANIVPAIQNWEAQVAAYTASHDAYLADAQNKINQATTEYNNSINNISNQRSTWLVQMEEEYRKGEADWLAMGRTEAKVSGPSGVEEASAAFSESLRLKSATTGSAPLPDLRAMQDLHNAVGKSTQGIMNLALAGAMNDGVVGQRKEMIESLARGLESQFAVTVDERGNVVGTRQVKDGGAARTGGDGTSFDHYKASTTEQKVQIAPPPAVKIAATSSSAFDNWDQKRLMQEHSANSNAGNDLKTAYYKQVNQELTHADNMRMLGELQYQDEVKRLMHNAIEAKKKDSFISGFIESVAGAMMGGLNMGSAVSSTVKNMTQNLVSEAIAEATGLPVGFIGGLTAGLKPHQAAYQHFENEAYRTFEESVGIEGAAGMLRQHLAEVEQNRKKDEAHRGLNNLNVINQMQHHEIGRTVGDTTLGLVSGRILSEATGLPFDAFTAGTAAVLSGGLGGAAVALMPRNMDEAVALSGDVDKLVRGEVNQQDLKKQYEQQFKARLEAAGNRIENLEKWQAGDVFSAVTGTIGSVITPVVSVVNNLIAPPKKPMSAAEMMFRQGITRTIGNATGLPTTLLESLIVQKTDMETALHNQAYADAVDALGMRELDAQLAQLGHPTVEGFLRGKVLEYETHKKAREAAKPRDSDFVPGIGALTYVWRNAEYSDEGRLALQLAETGAGVAAAMGAVATGGVSMYAYAAYMAAKEGYTSTGGTVGVLVGAASGAASAFGLPMGVGGSLSYSYEDGFTGNLSYGKAIGKLNLGGSINFAEGHGITGYGLNTGMGMGQGPFDQLGLNLNYRADGSFVGGALSGSNKWDSFNHGNLDRETSFRLGLNFDHTGSYTGTSTKVGLKNHFGDYDHDVHHEAGVGLTFHKAGNYDLELSSMVGADQNQQTGFYGWGAGVSGVWNFKPGGEMSGSSQNVDFEFRFQTAEQMQERYDGHQRRLAEYEAEPSKPSWLDKTLDWLGWSSERDFVDVADGMDQTCFTRGTLIRVSAGTRQAVVSKGLYYKKIEDIRPGDLVLAWNEKTGAMGYQPVQQTFIRQTEYIYEIQYEDGTTVETTWSHPFYVAGQGWVPAKDLKVGMKSPTATAIAKYNEQLALSGGMRLPVQTVAFSGHAVSGFSAAQVELGADLPGAVTIATIDVQERQETVYNFSVAETHNYFVTESGLLVHNERYTFSPDYIKDLYLACSDYSCKKKAEDEIARLEEMGVVNGGVSPETAEAMRTKLKETVKDWETSGGLKNPENVKAKKDAAERLAAGDAGWLDGLWTDASSFFSSAISWVGKLFSGQKIETSPKNPDLPEGVIERQEYIAKNPELCDSRGCFQNYSGNIDILAPQDGTNPTAWNNQNGTSGHNRPALDFGGTTWYAPNQEFKVLEVGHEEGYGGIVKIQLKNGNVLLFAHFNEINGQLSSAAANNETVTPGLFLGNTTALRGYSSGKHIHVHGWTADGVRLTTDQIRSELRSTEQ